METREKILEFLFSTDNGDDFIEWLHRLPPLEQVDVLNEYRAIVSEANPDPDNPALRAKLAEIETLTNAYQDAHLSAEVIQLKADVAQAEYEKAALEVINALEATKRFLREGIENNDPRAAEMIDYAQFIMDNEKQLGLYDPDEWAWFENR